MLRRFRIGSLTGSGMAIGQAFKLVMELNGRKHAMR
jgi:hypothetical protein